MNSHGKNQSELLQSPLSHWAIFIIPLWGFFSLVLFQINFPPLSHSLIGPDDYMRAVRIFDLLNDRAHPYLQPRMGIPPGGEVVWSRLADAPLLFLTMLFKSLAGTQDQAFFWAAAILPLLQLLGTLFLLCWAVAPVTGRRRAIISLLVLLFMTKVMAEYKPGRIDHHGWQIMLMLGGYGALLRQYFEPALRRWPLIAGGCFATSFAIGADLVLWTGLAVIITGIIWLGKGRDYVRPNFLFGLSLFTGTLIFLVLFKPPGGYLVPACDVLSVTYLALAAAVLLFWGAIYIVPETFQSSAGQRFMCASLPGLVLLGGIYALFPQCFTDIYGLDNEILYKVWISQDHESRPLWAHAEYYPYLTLYFVATVLLGLIAAIAATVIEKDRRFLWAGFSVALALGLTACAFHLRLMTFGQLLAIWPLCWALAALWERLKTMTLGIRELAAVSIVFIIALFILSGTKDSGEEAGKEPAVNIKLAENEYCPVSGISESLNEYDEQLTIITSYIFNGSELLFRTPHRVLAAPYHRNAAGIEATYRIFAAEADNAAYELARKYNVDMVLICPGYWPYPEQAIKEENALVRRLLKEQPPQWLDRIQDMTGGGFHVYRVR